MDSCYDAPRLLWSRYRHASFRRNSVPVSSLAHRHVQDTRRTTIPNATKKSAIDMKNESSSPNIFRKGRGFVWTCFKIAFVAPFIGLLIFVAAFALVVERCDTKYATGFSWREFRAIQPGNSATSLRRRLGEPEYKRELTSVQAWDYGTVKFIMNEELTSLDNVRWDVVALETYGFRQAAFSSAQQLVKERGAPKSVLPQHGIEYWGYSRSPSSSNYWQVGFLIAAQTGIILRKGSDFYFD